MSYPPRPLKCERYTAAHTIAAAEIRRAAIAVRFTPVANDSSSVLKTVSCVSRNHSRSVTPTIMPRSIGVTQATSLACE